MALRLPSGRKSEEEKAPSEQKASRARKAQERATSNSGQSSAFQLHLVACEKAKERFWCGVRHGKDAMAERS